MDDQEVIARLEAPAEDRRPTMAALERDAGAHALGGALTRAARARTRELAADLLGRRADRDGAGALRHALGDGDPGVRSAAADALGKVLLTHGASTVPGAGEDLMAAWVAEGTPYVRHTLAAALGAAHHEPARPDLERAAASQDDRGLAHAARWALEQLDAS